MRKRHSIILGLGLLLALAACPGPRGATPLPQPPGLELDIEKVSVDSNGGEGILIVGQADAVSIPNIEIRVTPGPTDSDPILEIGNATVDADGAFSVLVVSPLENTYYFERTDGDKDQYFAAISIDFEGNISEADPGPDADEDGSPDEIDCAPDDPTLGGQRCN
jgi:hypothetical protein